MHRRHGLFGLIGGTALALAAWWGAPGLAWGAEWVQIPIVAHVHTTWSSGNRSLDTAVAQAEALGMRGLVLTENYELWFEYGLRPWRRLIRKVITFPSVSGRKAEAWLAEIAAVQARHPGVILIPGVEVIPYYYWTGSLLGGDLAMDDAQRNLLVVGLTRAADYRALPLVGNGPRDGFTWGSLLPAVPGLLVLPGAWLWRYQRERRVRMGRFVVRQTRRYRLPALLLVLLGLAFLVDGFPFRSRPLEPYHGPLGTAPHQRLIDHVLAAGGLIFWSMPEANDYEEHAFGRLGKVVTRTKPYPHVLRETQGYTGFGAVYDDNRPFVKPGGGWVANLLEDASGRRARPVWGIAEDAYHSEGNKRFGRNVTIVLAETASRAGILGALRGGRMYAVQRAPAWELRLERFAVAEAGGAAEATLGETWRRAGGALEVRIAVRGSDEGQHPLEVTLVRDGLVAYQAKGETPWRATLADPALPVRGRHYYRLEVRGGGSELLANPVFVEG